MLIICEKQQETTIITQSKSFKMRYEKSELNEKNNLFANAQSLNNKSNILDVIFLFV